MTIDDEQAARQLFDALARFDLDVYESLLADDAVEGRPQLGERFVGRQNIMGMYRSFPGPPPTIVWRRIRGSGAIWVAEGTIAYGPDMGVDHLIAVVEMRDAKMIDSNLYFSSPLEPIPYHQPWAEPDPQIGPGPPA